MDQLDLMVIRGELNILGFHKGDVEYNYTMDRIQHYEGLNSKQTLELIKELVELTQYLKGDQLREYQQGKGSNV